MTSKLAVFISLDRSITTTVRLADGTLCDAQGKGVVKLNSCGTSCYIHDVLYVPDLDSNLLSIEQFLREGYTLHFEDFSCAVFSNKNKRNLLFKVPMDRNNMFSLALTMTRKHLQSH